MRSDVLAVRVYEKDLAPRGAVFAILLRGSDDLAKRARLAIVAIIAQLALFSLLPLAGDEPRLGWSWAFFCVRDRFRMSDHERELSEDRELSKWRS